MNFSLNNLCSQPVDHRVRDCGFSLVELSIVLVILGLLVGGILTGQALIRAAELRSVTTQYQKYIAATNSFRDKYFALPGDMTNAQSFWGVAHATPGTCVTTGSTGALTCNGDGDGIIFPSTGSNERYRFWQHLANAGLIEGSYDGITHGTTSYSSTTANSPAGRLTSTLWFVDSMGTLTGAGWAFDGVYNNYMEFGQSAANSDPITAALRPEELWNIDTKLDDGKPALGRVVARASPLSVCTTTVSSATLTADYLLTSASLTCAAIFRQVF